MILVDINFNLTVPLHQPVNSRYFHYMKDDRNKFYFRVNKLYETHIHS